MPVTVAAAGPTVTIMKGRAVPGRRRVSLAPLTVTVNARPAARLWALSAQAECRKHGRSPAAASKILPEVEAAGFLSRHTVSESPPAPASESQRRPAVSWAGS